jgi:multisubunit Na+/H+ antiporter MnhC subunit
VCFIGLTVVSVIALAVTDTRGAVPDALLVAILVPVVAVGHLAGRPLFAALARSRRYEPVVTAVLLTSVVTGLATAVL